MTTANPHRSEVVVEANGLSLKLKMTLGAMAAIEARGVKISELSQGVTFGDIVVVLEEAARAARFEGNVAGVVSDLSINEARDGLERLMSASFGQAEDDDAGNAEATTTEWAAEAVA